MRGPQCLQSYLEPQRPVHQRAWRINLGLALTPPAAVHGLVPASDADAAPSATRHAEARPAAAFPARTKFCTPPTWCAMRRASATATSNVSTRAAKHQPAVSIAASSARTYARGRRRWREKGLVLAIFFLQSGDVGQPYRRGAS